MNMKKYNFEAAKKFIIENANNIDTASLGMKEDWFWTAQLVFSDGEFLINLNEITEIAGVSGSSWATPSILIETLEGEEFYVDCYTGESNSSKPAWLTQGCLSGPCQVNADSKDSIDNIYH